MIDAYIYSLEANLVPGPTDQQSDILTTRSSWLFLIVETSLVNVIVCKKNIQYTEFFINVSLKSYFSDIIVRFMLMNKNEINSSSKMIIFLFDYVSLYIIVTVILLFFLRKTHFCGERKIRFACSEKNINCKLTS